MYGGVHSAGDGNVHDGYKRGGGPYGEEEDADAIQVDACLRLWDLFGERVCKTAG